ncbi:unnamed protein product [Prorocentrum cordatum]|uniref:Nucleoside diphosphate kinase n=1 Tax=Prorocentrum cordatum TaxID=2364126 RepID=A0ABN9U5N1_9DINO|nr:unnamed protein product [Polarella glacialis]
MLALEEKPRTVVLLWPQTKLDGMEQEIVTKFEDSYLEVKARKEIYLTGEDLERFFGFLPTAEREAPTASASAAVYLSEVLVLEHLDGDAIERTLAMQPEFGTFGAGTPRVYCSASPWDAVRDLEWFFPHLDALPVERTLALIKPDCVGKVLEGQTLLQVVEQEAAAAGLFVVGTREAVLTGAQAESLCADLRGSPDFGGAVGVLQKPEGAHRPVPRGQGRRQQVAPALRARVGRRGPAAGAHDHPRPLGHGQHQQRGALQLLAGGGREGPEAVLPRGDPAAAAHALRGETGHDAERVAGSHDDRGPF